MRTAKIIKCNYVGKKPTMDIEVNSKDHVFYADGVAVSNSHGISYGLNSYLSAMCKAKNPVKFYEVYLDHARRKADTQAEIKQLVYDARVHNIEVYPPRIGHFYANFTSIDNTIYFGISLIKNVGEEYSKIISSFENVDKDISWIEILAKHSNKIKKTAFIALISSGCLDGMNRPSRNQMLYEYDVWKNNLTDREIEFIASHIEPTESLSHHLNVLIHNFKLSKPRLEKITSAKKILDEPTSSMDDHPAWIAEKEEVYFGVSLTCSAGDAAEDDSINTTCKEIYQGVTRGKCGLAVTIDEAREFVIKKEGKNKGKKMAFLHVSDNTAMLDSVVVFPDTYEKYKRILYQGNTVVLQGSVSEDKKGLVVDNVCQIY